MALDDGIIQTGVRVETGELKAGMEEATSSVKAATTSMQAAYENLARTTIESVGAQSRLRDAIKQVATGAIQGQAAVKILTQELQDSTLASLNLTNAKKAIAEAQKQEAITATAVSQAIQQDTVSLEANVVALNATTAATQATSRSMLELRATAQLAAREAGIGAIPRALQGIVARSETLGPILAAAFPIVAAVAFADVIAQIADRLSNLIADTFIYTAANKQAFEAQVNANKEIVTALDRKRQAEDELFRATHTNVQNVQRDLELEREKRAGIARSIDEQIDKENKLRAVQNDRHFVTFRGQKGIGAEVTGANEAAQQELATTAATTAQLRAELASADAQANMLNERLREEKSAALKEAAANAKRLADEQARAEKEQAREAGRAFEEFKRERKEELDETVASLKEQIAEQDRGSQQIIVLYGKIHDAIVAEYGSASKEAQNALAELTRAQAAHEKFIQEENKKTEAEYRALTSDHLKATEDAILGEIEIKKQAIEQSRRDSKISSAEELKELNSLIQQKFDAEEKYLTQRRALYAGDAKEQAKLDEQLVKAQQSAQLEMVKAAQQAADQQRQSYQKAFAGIFNAMDTAINGFIQGTQTFTQALKNMLVGALTSEAEYLVKSRLQKAENYLLDRILHGSSEAAKLAVSTTTTAADVAAVTAAETEKATIRTAAQTEAYATTVVLNVSEIMSEAAVAAAGAFAATAVIPFVGPELAPAAAAAAYSAVSALAPLASAAGGMDVPHDMLAMVHKNEVILPAHLADNFRKMGNAGAAGGSASINVSSSISTVDSRGFERVMRQNSSLIATEVARLLRQRRLG